MTAGKDSARGKTPERPGAREGGGQQEAPATVRTKQRNMKSAGRKWRRGEDVALPFVCPVCPSCAQTHTRNECECVRARARAPTCVIDKFPG